MSTTTAESTTRDVRTYIEHNTGCPEQRTETIHHGDGIVVARCCDCAAQFPGEPPMSGPLAQSADPVAHYRNEIDRAERRIARKENN